MDNHIKLFKTHSDYEAFVETNDYIEPHVSLCEDLGHVNYNLPPKPKIKALKFSSPNACTLGINNIGTRNAQYSKDKQNWTDWDGSAVTFGNGTDLYVRGNNPDGWTTPPDFYQTYAKFTMTGSEISCEGNIMHMLSYEKDLDTIPCDYCYFSMFQDCTSLIDAPELPATTLAKGCYLFMFSDCSSLVDAPELPVTALADGCYSYMFQNCTSLVDAPKLPATKLAEYCYQYMFSGCSSLVDAPELPATTLIGGCYSGMFNACTSLVDAPELPATTLAEGCYTIMFQDCTSLVDAPELPATTLIGGCYGSMFNGCTSLVDAPELPVTTLAEYCYADMFQGCTSLVNAPELPATTLVEGCYASMFEDCSELNHIKMLATNIQASDCLLAWTSGVSSTGTFECTTGMSTVIPRGDSGIPNGWTVTEVSNIDK